MSRFWGAVCAGSGLCVLAAGVPVVAFYVPGLALLALALSARGLTWLAARDCRVTLRAPEDRVVAGEPMRVALAVSGRLRGFCQARAQIDRTAAAVLLGDEREVTVQMRLRGRGRTRLGPASVSLCDPLSLCVRAVAGPAWEVLVLPRVQSLDREWLLSLSSTPLPDMAAMDLLRRHRPGTPASRVHWPTAARTGKLYERGGEHDGAPSRPLVVLDASGAVSAAQLDWAVSATASLCAGLARLGGCRLLLPGSSSPSPCGSAQWPQLHARLALVEADTCAPRWEADAGTRVIVVSAARPPLLSSDARRLVWAPAGRAGDRGDSRARRAGTGVRRAA